MLAFTRLSFLIGPYIMNAAARNDEKSPGVSWPERDLAATPYQSAPTAASPPMNSISGGSADSALVIRMFVRYSSCDAAAEPRGLARFGAERLDDAMAGERLGGQVRDVLELLLAAPRRPPHALPEPDERIDDERRRRHADERQPPVEVEQEAGEADDRERLAHQIRQRLGDRLLHLVDVVRDARHQLAGRPAREERRRLIEDVPEQPVAQVHARRAGRRRSSG